MLLAFAAVIPVSFLFALVILLLSAALKWSCPAARRRTFFVLVILNLFAIAFTVFSFIYPVK